MASHRLLISVLFSCRMISPTVLPAESLPLQPQTKVQTFSGKGVAMELKADRQMIVVKHEAISNYMEAMTMPFKTRDWKGLASLHIGDQISFRLNVTESESWIDQIVRIGAASLRNDKEPPGPQGHEVPSAEARHPLMDYKFTNELGQAVSLGEFRGQALAITFFFTRCPIPDFCPRLAKNFQEASRKLTSMSGAPTNWHFLSVTFDPQVDTPAMLKTYAERYRYDPAHWSFLTGPSDKIGELAQLSDVKFERGAGLIDHNFRTLIVDAAGHVQMVFPMGGNLSDAIVDEVLKAASATNRATKELGKSD